MSLCDKVMFGDVLYLGLGLYVVWLVVECYGGMVLVCNLDDGSGVVFML